MLNYYPVYLSEDIQVYVEEVADVNNKSHLFYAFLVHGECRLVSQLEGDELMKRARELYTTYDCEGMDIFIRTALFEYSPQLYH
jgi:hypothetical protein